MIMAQVVNGLGGQLYGLSNFRNAVEQDYRTKCPILLLQIPVQGVEFVFEPSPLKVK